MFYCDACGQENEWPEGFIRSHGKCELCGRVADCNDVRSSALPNPKPKTAEPPKEQMVQIWVHARTAKTLRQCALGSGEEIEDIVEMAVVKLKESLGV